MDKKYILIATPKDLEINGKNNYYSGTDIIELISGAYFESEFEYQDYTLIAESKYCTTLASKDKSIELVFIIVNNCQNIYNGITLNQSFKRDYAHIWDETDKISPIDLVITVVKENSFIEFFHHHWNFFNIENNIPVISIKKPQSTIDDMKYLGSKFLYNRDNQLIELNINYGDNDYYINNFFSQLVYSLVKQPELIIYCSSLNTKYSFIKDLCQKFFPHVLIKVAHPHRNNKLVLSKLITSSKNKIILFVLDEDLLELSNLNFFLDLSHAEPERCLLSCASKSIENNIGDFMFCKQLEDRINERKQQYTKYANNDDETQQCLSYLNLLSNKLNEIHSFLDQAKFYGNDINADSHILHYLEKKLNMEFGSVGIVSGVNHSQVKAYIMEILEEKFDSIENYNKYYTINADNVNIADGGDFHQRN